MASFTFTPEQGITFRLYASVSANGPSICELTGKKIFVTILRRSGIPTGVLVRLEDPAHPEKTWIFNSSKHLDDGVPFRRFEVISGGSPELRATGFYGDEDVDAFGEFASRCILIETARGIELEEPEWSISLEPRFVFSSEREMLNGPIPYQSPFGSTV